MKKTLRWTSLITTIIILIITFLSNTTDLNTFLIFSNATPSNYDAVQIEIMSDNIIFNGKSYEIVEVEGGDQSGSRLPNVAVDIGFGDRQYWGFTNEYSQLVYVYANQIVLQNDRTEAVLSTGRYYSDEARVPGTERPYLDQGHVIADSLGGVSNAYNITPQDSTLNRHGDQAYMEKTIRDANGCVDFYASITYPNHSTQIPSQYKIQYQLKGRKIVDEFKNVDPDEANRLLNSESNDPQQTDSFDEQAELKKIDVNQNGIVSIAEAQAAGYKMPIYADHWLYIYMTDADGDGKVGK
ncbi:DNA/RNA non-specific endonuclease [Fusibacter ferrireducens]|uniref:DNA/RNA non-specific endonuclease n=1 Tax=Fusibacter ferrireducens TaxID=2785058 RepID=A0ABR9ZV42_9FIRM|nr:DNA/RNA non-specific endonuclease [Fusibacter ferrireducens]MBF4694298.1 DNA/RNA non-specific endonuclease [Fusibacter ferrireducens]